MKRFLSYPVVLLVSVLLAVVWWGCAESRTVPRAVVVTVPAGAAGLTAPSSVVLPSGDGGPSVWEMVPEGGSGAKPAYGQMLRDGGSARLVFTAEPADAAGASVRYRLRRPSSPVADAFSFSDDGAKFFTLSEGTIPVFTYIYARNLEEGVPEDRARSQYIHPLYDLDGRAVTDDFPADHFHHRGVFIAWPHVVLHGDTLSTWDLRGVENRFERWLGRESGPVFARLGVQTGWYAGGTKIVEETLWMIVHRAGGIGRAIDFDLTLLAVKDPVTLKGQSAALKGYGGFNFRPAPFDGRVVITTGAGVQEDSDMKRFPWADFSATFKGAQSVSGVAIFQHPSNPGAPSGWCLRHYGFLGVNWPGLEPSTLEPGKPFRARWRIWVHRGDAAGGGVARAYELYANPPSAAPAD